MLARCQACQAVWHVRKTKGMRWKAVRCTHCQGQLQPVPTNGRDRGPARMVFGWGTSLAERVSQAQRMLALVPPTNRLFQAAENELAAINPGSLLHES